MVEIVSEKPTVAIIGAGFSGLCSFIRLQAKLGIQAQLFELSDDIGGTWRQNVYPGCSCDLPSHMYSLSTDLNPNWTLSCSPQAEILSYMKNVATKYNIYAHTRLSAEVLKATWLKERHKWQLDVREKGNDNIETHYFDIIISGMGGLRIPNIPAEFKAFDGPVVHTAAWDWSTDFKNKRVAIIGSGSSACQTMPFLAENASRVVSYQRNPAWVLPRDDFKFSEFVKWVFTYIPFSIVLYRLYLFYHGELLYLIFGYPDSSFTKRKVQSIEKAEEAKLLELNRPDLVQLLKPKYRLGCKRVVFSSEYLDAIAKPNVSVINAPIKEIQSTNKIVTEDGQVNEFDVLVLATGYKTQQGVLGNIEIIGENGKSLTELWDREKPQFYNSTVANGFPNFFMLLGPTTILGHHSVLSIIEIQVKYTVNCIQDLIFKKNMRAVEPTAEAQEKYMAKWKNDLKGTVWTTSCTSWYKNELGEITSLYPNTVSRFGWTLAKVKEEDFVVYPPRI